MPRHLLSILTLLLSAAAPAAAQDAETSAAYERAAAMVRDGQGEEGRRIVDSLFIRAREGTPAHAVALYWRAALARDAQQAERDYRQLVVNYPLAPHADRALLALAQLELTRGDRERAISHLQRIEREHPAGAMRATAAFWMARIRFEMNDEPRACASLDVAQRAAAPENVELRNQIEFLGTRCVGVERDTTTNVAGGRGSGAGSNTNVTAGGSETGATTAERTTSRGSAPDPRPAARYAVQVAAYTTRTDAEALVKRLARRDVRARVVGTSKPFRVWTGNYATRAEAVAAQQKLRLQKIEGFVVQQPATP